MMNHNAEDGCFAVIPGSHKANFVRPFGNHPDENPGLTPLDAQPGDCIIFTEALTHGSMVNTSEKTRRTLYFCYSVGYMPDWSKFGLQFTEEFLDLRLSWEFMVFRAFSNSSMIFSALVITPG